MMGAKIITEKRTEIGEWIDVPEKETRGTLDGLLEKQTLLFFNGFPCRADSALADATTKTDRTLWNLDGHFYRMTLTG